MAVLVSDVLATVRTYLNDDNASVWSDGMLIPKLREAHRELQTKLWLVGSPVVREESAALTITATTGTSITTATSPALPADLLTPTKLFEYAATVETAADAKEMTETIYLPKIAQAATLIYWTWRKEGIQLIGASVDRKVVIQYRKQITLPTVVGDPIGILFGELYLSARVAAMAAGSVANKDVYESMTELAKANFDMVVKSQRGQQQAVNRP